MSKAKSPPIADKYDPPDSPASVGWTEGRRLLLATAENPLQLDCGESIAPVEVEFETYGTLNADKSNAVLICHALSGDAHAAGWDKNHGHKGRAFRKKYPGWWDSTIGPGKAFDTDKYFIICSNVLGSCYGTTSPASPNPHDPAGKPYGLKFPVVTVSDWVRLQKRLIDALEIPKLLCVAGGSLGGQQALDWTLQFPDRTASAMILAASAKLSSQGIGFNKIGRHAIASDTAFQNGDYYANDATPSQGLAVARMIGHLTYLSEESMNVKFGRRLRRRDAPGFHFDIDYEVESYLDHQGRSFTERFDANSYLYITKAMDYYDAADYGQGDLAAALERVTANPLIVSFSSDWLYPPAQCRALAEAFCRNRKPVTYVELPSIYGHDAFLVETTRMSAIIRGFLANQQIAAPGRPKSKPAGGKRAAEGRRRG